MSYVEHIEERIKSLSESLSLPKYQRVLFVEDGIKPCASLKYSSFDTEEENLKKKMLEEDIKILENNGFKTKKDSFNKLDRVFHMLYFCKSEKNYDLNKLESSNEDKEMIGKMYGFPKPVINSFTDKKERMYCVRISETFIDSILRGDFNYEDLVAASASNYMIYPNKKQLDITVKRGYEKFKTCREVSQLCYEFLLAESSKDVLPFKKYLNDGKCIEFQSHKAKIDEEQDIRVEGKKYKNKKFVNPENKKLPMRKK